MFKFRVGDFIDCRDASKEAIVAMCEELIHQGWDIWSEDLPYQSLLDGIIGKWGGISVMDNMFCRANKGWSSQERYLKASEVLSKLNQTDSKDCSMSKLKTYHEALQTLLKQREELDKKIIEAEGNVKEAIESLNESFPEGYKVVECEGIADVDNPENWRNGDRMEIVDVVDDTHEFDIGSVVTILDVSAMNRSNHAPKVESGDGSRRWVQAENLKFHSRPRDQEFVEGDIPVGSVWEYVGGGNVISDDLTVGKHYKITGLDDQDPEFTDDIGDDRAPWFVDFLQDFKRIK